MMSVTHHFILEAALWAAVISTGIMAGIYCCFSLFVMSSLNALSADLAINTMNSVNRIILSSAFMPLFFGSSALALMTLIITSLYDPKPLSILASLGYLVGMLGVTIFANVPLNNQLQGLKVDMLNAKQHNTAWNRYYHAWTKWNHVRSITSTLSFIGYVYFLKTV